MAGFVALEAGVVVFLVHFIMVESVDLRCNILQIIMLQIEYSMIQIYI